MIFTVVWTPAADDELTEIWVQALDQQDVTDAVDRIGRLLRRDPLAKLKHLHEGLYVFEAEPLAVLCEVQEDDRRVQVVQVRRAKD